MYVTSNDTNVCAGSINNIGILLKLPVVVMNLFYISGTAPVVPFLPVYARQLGFSGVIVGMIYTVLPITGMLAKPIFGAIADRFRLQKTLFLAFQIVTAISFFVIQFIPEIQTESTARSAVLDCDAEIYFRFCSKDIDSCTADRLVAETSSNNTTISCEVCMLCATLVMLGVRYAMPQAIIHLRSCWWLCVIVVKSAWDLLCTKQQWDRIFFEYTTFLGHAVVQLVEALCYELEGHKFDSQWCHWTFSLT